MVMGQRQDLGVRHTRARARARARAKASARNREVGTVVGVVEQDVASQGHHRESIAIAITSTASPTAVSSTIATTTVHAARAARGRKDRS